MTEPQVGVVLNPSKLDSPEEFRREVSSIISDLGVSSEVQFYETTVKDPGTGPAKQAVADGCSLVIAAGGDGTVRLVAGALAGTEVSMGIVPMGTGNLFARNIDIPIDSFEEALKIAVLGNSHPVDLGWVGSGSSDSEARSAAKEPFLVITGFGFDAAVMENTDSRLKKAVGWIAYVVAGAQKIAGRSQTVALTLDGRKTRPARARTVMVGNVGRLPGGVTLMPGADASNGSLEILTLDWKGALGFTQILREMVTPINTKSLAKISSKRTYQAREVTAAAEKDLPFQVDGDYVGDATHLHATVQPQALLMRITDDVTI